MYLFETIQHLHCCTAGTCSQTGNAAPTVPPRSACPGGYDDGGPGRGGTRARAPDTARQGGQSGGGRRGCL